MLPMPHIALLNAMYLPVLSCVEYEEITEFSAGAVRFSPVVMMTMSSI